MSFTVTVTGTGDDMIVVDGDISEEFDYLRSEDDAHALLAFSDGTILRIRCDDNTGVWRINLVARGTADLDIVQAPDDDLDHYTDQATLTGDVTWVVHGIAHATARRVRVTV